MWIAITIAIILTILFFSIGSNRQQDRFPIEGPNNGEDPGSDDANS